MKKKIFLVCTIHVMYFSAFLISCDKGEDNQTSSSSLTAPNPVITQHNSCDWLEWNSVAGAEKYRVMESTSRTELEKINYPMKGSAYPVMVYVDLYQTHLTLCDKLPLSEYRNANVMYYVVFAIGKSDDDYRRSGIISYAIRR